MSDNSVNPVQNTKRKELFLDTKGVCFLCLNENLEHNDGMVETCLRNICRFLDIDQSSILLNGLKENLRQEEARITNEKRDFSVPLCSTCSSLTANLSDMIRQMEIIRMLTTYQLQVFNQIINASNRESSTQEHSLGNLKSSSPLDAYLVESLRNVAAMKSLTKVKALKAEGYPKVVLNKTDVTNYRLETTLNTDRKSSILCTDKEVPLKDHISNDKEVFSSNQLLQTKPSIKKIWACKLENGGCGKIFSTKSNLKKHTVRSCSNRKNKQTENSAPNHVRTEPSSSQQNIFKTYCGQETIPVETGFRTKYWCLICESVKKSRVITTVHWHLVSIHPEKFFSGKKLPELSEDQFRLCCRNALHLEAKQVERLPGKKIYEGSAICPHCGIQKSNLQQMRYHLMLKHLEILERKVMILQDDMKSSTENLSPLQTPQKRELSKRVYPASSKVIDLSTPHISKMLAMHSKLLTNGTYQCLLCSTSGVKRDLQIHLVNIHPEKIFASEMLPEFPVEQFTACCRQLLSNQSQGKPQKMANRTLETPEKTKVSCYICGIKKSEFCHLKYHMVLQHYDILGESLRQFQESALLQN